MPRTNATKPKLNPPLGTLPVLQYCSPDQLLIDEDYQRSLDTERSQALIRRIAAHWDWGLCQPLFVARRGEGGLYVVDGQHRLAAAKLRGDIWQLPCVVSAFATAAEEAATFVALNQQRRPLTQLDLFKAALASGDGEARALVGALAKGGGSLAGSSNNQNMKPGALGNVSGLLKCLRMDGEKILELATAALVQAYPGEVLRYGGSIFPGVAAVVADEVRIRTPRAAIVEQLAALTGATPQARWYQMMSAAIAEDPNIKRGAAMVRVMRHAWRESKGFASAPRPATVAVSTATDLKPAEMAWCVQCEQRRSGAQAASCTSPFCKLKAKAA